MHPIFYLGKGTYCFPDYQGLPSFWHNQMEEMISILYLILQRYHSKTVRCDIGVERANSL